MTIHVVPSWMKNLENEDINFIKRFILASGSLKDMAKEYNVSYPTVRNKLDKLIEKISLNDEKEDPYIMLIKKMTIDGKIEFEAAKLLIETYRKNNEKK